MGRKFTAGDASPFYPPRAGWFSAVFSLGNTIQRRLALDRLVVPGQVTIPGLLAGLLVPGLAFYLRGPRLWGQVALSACAILMMTYIVWLGYPAANLAFGMLISVHCSGFVYYCSPLLAGESFRGRLTLTFMVLLAIMILLYWPARNLAQQHLVTPLRMGGHVIVVRRMLPPQTIQRGDCMYYTLPESSTGEAHNGGAIWFRGGAGMGSVLAVGGDHVVFSPAVFYVNGVLHTNLPCMPVSGEWVVPEKHWFVWPNLAISGHGNISGYSLSTAMLQLADVAPNQYLGQPFNRWFWRKQILP